MTEGPGPDVRGHRPAEINVGLKLRLVIRAD